QPAVSYLDFGIGEPVVLLHGTLGDLWGYSNLIAELGSGIRALSYNQRDADPADESDAQPYDMADLADDCVALLDALGLETAHIVGSSFGGGVGLHVAARHPGRVRSLVVAAAPPSWSMVQQQAPTHLDPVARQQFMVDALVAPEIRAADPDLA